MLVPRRSHDQTTPDDSIRRLNLPRPLVVEADAQGLPRVVGSGAARQRVTAIVDLWRIDDEWWREPLSRRYFVVTLESGAIRTVFQDLIAGGWYEQAY